MKELIQLSNPGTPDGVIAAKSAALNKAAKREGSPQTVQEHRIWGSKELLPDRPLTSGRMEEPRSTSSQKFAISAELFAW